MNIGKSRSLRSVGFLAVHLSAAALGRSEQPASVGLFVAGAGFPFTLNVETHGTRDFLLQSATNLQDWRPFVQVFSRLSSFRLVERPVFSFTQRDVPVTQFQRAAGHAQSPAEMRTAWEGLNMKHYRFKFIRECFHCDSMPITVSGTVTVQDGNVMAVQDIVDPGAPSNPIENPDLTQFKSIEDLFDIIAERFQTVDLMYLRLDETLHFPAWTFIDHLYDAADDEITYYVKDVERLE